MMVFGGIGIDMMHAELKRTKLQNTLDRAVLAAADMDNALDPTFVVNDYLAAAGMTGALTADPEVQSSYNSKRVSASGQQTASANFLRLLGVNELQANALATAEEGLAEIEISLVLDISGSMGGSKIANLKDAADEFIDIVLDDEENEDETRTTISVVPYNATVNLGETLSQYFTFEPQQDYSWCATFPSSAFYETAVHADMPLTKLAHFDPNGTSTTTTAIQNPWCYTGDEAAMMIHSSDGPALKSHIRGLNASGNTAIDLGVKWGLAMLDPAAQPVVDALVEDGRVASDLRNRPAPYDDPDVFKFMVVMTDGENTTQYDLRDDLKYGMSDVWIDDHGNSSPYDDHFSVRVRDWNGTNNDVYYWVQQGNSYGNNNRYRNNAQYRNYPQGRDGARRMTQAEVYARWAVRGAAYLLYERPYYDGYLSYNEYVGYHNAYQATVSGSQADDRLSDICRAARNEGVVIYAIGFEAPQSGLDAMSDCATSPAHFFDVEGRELEDVFASIARSLNQLRLTQ